MTGLTPKQEAFAVAFVETGNAAEAYRRAYDVEASARDEWIYVEAIQIRDHPKVAPRISELQERAKAVGQYTINEAANELEEARQLALKEAQAGAAVSAVNSKVKLFGLDKPTKFQEVDGDGKPVHRATEHETARAIAHLLSQGLNAGS